MDTRDYHRKMIDFDDSMYERLLAYKKKRGCRSFGETVRDIIREYLYKEKQQPEPGSVGEN